MPPAATTPPTTSSCGRRAAPRDWRCWPAAWPCPRRRARWCRRHGTRGCSGPRTARGWSCASWGTARAARRARRTVEVGAVEWNAAAAGTIDTGLQYLRARYFDPSTGRFLSKDALSAAPGSDRPAFEYAESNPADLVDPYALCGLKLSLGNVRDCAKRAATTASSGAAAVGNVATACLKDATCTSTVVLVGVTAATGGNVAAGLTAAGAVATVYSAHSCAKNPQILSCTSAGIGVVGGTAFVAGNLEGTYLLLKPRQPHGTVGRRRRPQSVHPQNVP